ncbi:MAG: hypothetical protein II377_00010, partial [Clostridia bacterium]|nr:hypothetical protein [Clostridia bacterium]
PSGIGVFPFTPVFLESRRVSGESLGIPVGEIVTMPCIGSYIGGDAVYAVVNHRENVLGGKYLQGSLECVYKGFCGAEQILPVGDEKRGQYEKQRRNEDSRKKYLHGVYAFALFPYGNAHQYDSAQRYRKDCRRRVKAYIPQHGNRLRFFNNNYTAALF